MHAGDRARGHQGSRPQGAALPGAVLQQEAHRFQRPARQRQRAASPDADAVDDGLNLDAVQALAPVCQFGADHQAEVVAEVRGHGQGPEIIDGGQRTARPLYTDEDRLDLVGCRIQRPFGAARVDVGTDPGDEFSLDRGKATLDERQQRPRLAGPPQAVGEDRASQAVGAQRRLQSRRHAPHLPAYRLAGTQTNGGLLNRIGPREIGRHGSGIGVQRPGGAASGDESLGNGLFGRRCLKHLFIIPLKLARPNIGAP